MNRDPNRRDRRDERGPREDRGPRREARSESRGEPRGDRPARSERGGRSEARSGGDRPPRRDERRGEPRSDRGDRPRRERGDRGDRGDRGGRGGRSRPSGAPPARRNDTVTAGGGGIWGWIKSLFAPKPATRGMVIDEARAIEELGQHLGIHFNDTDLLKLALTHRSFLHIQRGTSKQSNERLEFLGDSVLGVIVSEHLYKTFPEEHEGQLTKT
ncbi:MAG: ribonuclease III domain-containing protein, partial [Vicinamibacteria bacterium]